MMRSGKQHALAAAGLQAPEGDVHSGSGPTLDLIAEAGEGSAEDRRLPR